MHASNPGKRVEKPPYAISNPIQSPIIETKQILESACVCVWGGGACTPFGGGGGSRPSRIFSCFSDSASLRLCVRIFLRSFFVSIMATGAASFGSAEREGKQIVCKFAGNTT